jgi:hypothetical protein
LFLRHFLFYLDCLLFSFSPLLLLSTLYLLYFTFPFFLCIHSYTQKPIKIIFHYFNIKSTHW